MKGLVIRGSKNIFTIKNESGELLECRIKGKVLKGIEGFYNPLAPGDFVEYDEDPLHPGTGLIINLIERKNAFTRFNQKGQASQLLAANVDLLCCITTPASPPFRPRFLDRVLLQGEKADIPSIIICNKYDLSEDDPDVEERLEDFIRIGYPVLRVSAKNGEGIDELKSLLKGKISVMVGQSGVGKSSLINALISGLQIKTGDVNEKYDRGNHTTTLATLYEMPDNDGIIIDTPGVRQIIPDGIDAQDVILYMKEFAPLAGKCSFGLSCSHETEPGCKIMEAEHAGVIHEDRYESFLRIKEELSGK
jgi:ribosome biogenesis GTPase